MNTLVVFPQGEKNFERKFKQLNYNIISWLFSILDIGRSDESATERGGPGGPPHQPGHGHRQPGRHVLGLEPLPLEGRHVFLLKSQI